MSNTTVLVPQKLLGASEKTAAFFEKHLDPDCGELTFSEVAGDLAAQYKLPTLLMITGRGRLAHKVLDNIKKKFLQDDGDFLSFPEKEVPARKSDSQDFQLYWFYMNGWVAMAAQRLGRFDIAVPARRYLEKFYNPALKGYGVSPTDLAADNKSYNVDVFMSSHLGLLALYFGDNVRATEIGGLIADFVSKQPDLDKHFLVKMHGDSGCVMENFPEEKANYYRISRKEPQQLYFLLGYPVFFLYFLSRATRDTNFLKPAETILDFLMKCENSIYSFFLAHKVGYGAGLMAQATGKEVYRSVCEKIVANLLSLQEADGSFLRDLPTQAKLDQSAEIAVWLGELGNNLTTLI